MKKRLFLVIITLIILLSSGCKSKVESTKIELTFRITWDAYSGRGDAINEIVKRYNDSQNKVIVNMISGNEDMQEIETLLSSEDCPEVMVLPYRHLQELGKEEKLLTFDNVFTTEMVYFEDSIVNMSKVDNQLFGVPWIGHTMALIYNKNILDEAGVDPFNITNFDELEQALIRVESNTTSSGIGLVGANHHDISWMTSQFIYSFGGSLVNEEKNEVIINSPESMDALNYYINILGAHAQDGWEYDNGEDVMEHFRNQEVAFEIQGPWGITDIWKAGDPFEVGAISFARFEAYSEVGLLMLTIPNSIASEKKESAIDFIRFMIQIDSLEQILDGEYIAKYDEYYPFRIPIRKDMSNNDFFIRYPYFNEFVLGFEYPSINTPIPKWNTIHDNWYLSSLHEVVIGNMTIEEFLQYIQSEGNKLIE